MSDLTAGTHGGRRRPVGGWPNVKAPEHKPGRKIRKARARLAQRIEAWEAGQKNSKTHHMGGYRKPGSLKCK